MTPWEWREEKRKLQLSHVYFIFGGFIAGVTACPMFGDSVALNILIAMGCLVFYMPIWPLVIVWNFYYGIWSI
jgi:hypothetical protein